jgi:hypothetical protein
MHVPVYATLNGCNGGLLLDLSPAGMGVQAVAPLHRDETILLHFELPRPRMRIEAAAQVAWASPSGQAGLRFAGMRPQTQRLLQTWIASTQAATPLVARAQTDFFPIATREERTAVATATLPPAVPQGAAEPASSVPQQAVEPASMHLPLWPRSIANRTLATIADAMIVLLAVLMFVVISLSISGAVPSWSLWLISAVVLAGFFGFLYRYLFATYAGRTAGQHLAGLGDEDSPAKFSPEDLPSK